MKTRPGTGAYVTVHASDKSWLTSRFFHEFLPSPIVGQPALVPGEQVFVYSQPDEVMDIITFSNPAASGGLLGHHQASTSSSARAGRGLR